MMMGLPTPWPDACMMVDLPDSSSLDLDQDLVGQDDSTLLPH